MSNNIYIEFIIILILIQQKNFFFNELIFKKSF